MDDIIRLIERYPFLILILIAVLAQIFGGRKKSQERAEEAKRKREELVEKQRKLREQMAERQKEGRGSDLMAALRNARSAGTAGAASGPMILASAPVLGDVEVDDSTSMERPIAERASVEGDAYDVRSNVYDDEPELRRLDTDVVPVTVHRGYSYHSAIEEPAEKEYHTSTFFGFQEVHGLHTTGPVAAGQLEQETTVILKEPPKREEIVRAIVLGEVLGPPLARRSRR